MTADPVSWMVIEPGWSVVGPDGDDIGRVDEVIGDENADIFTGLKVLTGMLGKPKYIPSEQVAEIVDGRVQVTVAKDDLRDWSETP